VSGRVDAVGDQRGDGVHVLGLEAARGEGGEADAQARGVEGLARIEGHRVGVELDAAGVEDLRDLAPAEVLRAQVDEHRWLSVPPVIRRSRGRPGPRRGPGRWRRSARRRWELVGGRASLKRDRLAGGGVVVRAALQAGEHRLVDRRGVAALHRIRPPRGPRRVLWVVDGHDVGVGDRLGWTPAGDQAGDVGDVGGQIGADLLGDLGEGREVERARVSRCAGPDQPRSLLAGEAADLVHVDAVGRRGARRTARRLK
jgi:hypothetical protein